MSRICTLFFSILVLTALVAGAGPACFGEQDESPSSPATPGAHGCLLGLDDEHLAATEDECNPLEVRGRLSAFLELVGGKFQPAPEPLTVLERNGLSVPVRGNATEAQLVLIERGLFKVFTAELVALLHEDGAPVDRLNVYLIDRDFAKTVMHEDLMGLTFILRGCVTDASIAGMALGYYHPGPMTIVLLEDRPGTLEEYTVVHEAGHALDNLLAPFYRDRLFHLSPTHKFFMLSLVSGVLPHYLDLKKGEGGEFPSWYASTNVFEYFAEAVTHYLAVLDRRGQPARLATKDPAMFLTLRRFLDPASDLYLDRYALGRRIFGEARDLLSAAPVPGLFDPKTGLDQALLDSWLSPSL